MINKKLSNYLIPLQRFIWLSNFYRPTGVQYHYSRKPHDIEEKMYEIATQESALYIMKNMRKISGTIDPLYILEFCVKVAPDKGLFLEFGVYRGGSINHIAKFTDQLIHGFDSFEGTPEDWETCPRGAYDANGKIPKAPDHVIFHKGWFNETIPEFKKNYSDNIAFMHIDSDLYSSAKTIFDELGELIVPGTVIVFDEYFNYPGWQYHEFKAFQEFVHKYNVKYEYIAWCRRGYSAALQIKEITHNTKSSLA